MTVQSVAVGLSVVVEDFSGTQNHSNGKHERGCKTEHQAQRLQQAAVQENAEQSAQNQHQAAPMHKQQYVSAATGLPQRQNAKATEEGPDQPRSLNDGFFRQDSQ